MKKLMKIVSMMLVLSLCINFTGMTAHAEEYEEPVFGQVYPDSDVVYATSRTDAYADDFKTLVIPNFAPGTPLQVTGYVYTKGWQEWHQINLNGTFIYIKIETVVPYGNVTTTTITYTNPNTGFTKSATYSNVAEAEVIVDDMLLNRASKFTFSNDDLQSQLLIRSMFKTYYNGPSKYYQTFSNNTGGKSIHYDTTDAQEAYVDQMVDQVIPSLNIDSDYDKIKNVNNWICDNVKYSYDTYRGWDGYIYAYNALADGTTVCYGYAQLFQKFMEKMGIESYFMGGVPPYLSEGHAFNVVCLDGQWYLIDVTGNDTSGNRNKYFLLGTKELNGTTAISGIILAPSRYKK